MAVIILYGAVAYMHTDFTLQALCSQFPKRIKKGADIENLALCAGSLLRSLIQKHFGRTKMCGEYIVVAACDYACFETGIFLKQ